MIITRAEMRLEDGTTMIIQPHLVKETKEAYIAYLNGRNIAYLELHSGVGDKMTHRTIIPMEKIVFLNVPEPLDSDNQPIDMDCK